MRPEGFEGQCDYCGDWWPLTVEFWYPKHGLRRCKACWATYHREHEAGRRSDDILRRLKNQRDRERYYTNRPARLAANRKWKEANRERVAEYNRAYRERRRAA